MTMEQEIRYRDAEPGGGGVSDPEVESVMKMLMAYRKARAEGVGQPNPELDHLLGAMQNNIPTDRPTDCPIDEELKFPSGATQPGPAPTSDEIIPKPFFVLKTKNEKQQKVFINVCGSHKIGAPDYGEETPETVDEVRAKLANFNPSEDPDCPDVRFPCSCLDPVSLKNKKDKTNVIYDMCFNRTVVESAMTVKSLKVFLIDMSLTWICQKYETQLSPDFQILERKYKGKEVRKHFIRVDPKKGPIITELPDDDDDEEPVVPLLLRDKQGKSSGDTVEETCKSDANRDHELPEWARPSDRAIRELAEAVTPMDQPIKTAEGVEFRMSRLTAPNDTSEKPKPSEPWLPAGMFRELNTPAPDPDVDTSVPDLNAERQEAHSPHEIVETTPKKTSTSKFKLKKLEKKVENSDERIQDDVQEGPLVEDLRAPKVQTDYIGRPATTIAISVTFPLDFIGLEDMHVYMTSTGIFIDTKDYGPIEVELQFYVSPAGVLAEYIICDKTLMFELPIVSYAEAQKLRL